jgi:hypothetical protein
MLTASPGLIVILLTKALAEQILGLHAPEGINTLIVLYGTKPPSQLEAVFQSLLVVQFHVS